MIDLSKAYAGQIAHLNDGNEFTIKSIKEKDGIYDVNLFNSEIWYYTKQGIYLGGTDCKYPIHLNISSLEDDYYVQIARLEGEIKGYENILLCKPAASTFDYICAKRLECVEQLKALQDENS